MITHSAPCDNPYSYILSYSLFLPPRASRQPVLSHSPWHAPLLPVLVKSLFGRAIKDCQCTEGLSL